MLCFILFTTDIWLMRNSFEFHGVFDSLQKAIMSAQIEKLLTEDNHVVIDSCLMDHYESTGKRVFSTQSDADRKRLLETPLLY